MIVIDGISYDVPVLSVKMNGDVLDKYAERMQDGTLQRELIGVYFNYELRFGRTTNTAVYAALWEKITEPVEFHTITVPDESGDYTFTCYVSNISHELFKETGAANFWKNLTFKAIGQSPARVP